MVREGCTANFEENFAKNVFVPRPQAPCGAETVWVRGRPATADYFCGNVLILPVCRKYGAPSGQADTYPLTSGWDTQAAHTQARWTQTD
eukprot:5571727-Prymnesium_polylepis.1